MSVLRSHAWRGHGLAWLDTRIDMGIVTFSAVIDLPFTVPAFYSLAMRAILPIPVGSRMALAANPIGLFEGH